MANKCDLEEAKHQALQKCRELLKEPEKWEDKGWRTYHRDKFTIASYTYASGDVAIATEKRERDKANCEAIMEAIQPPKIETRRKPKPWWRF